MADLRILATEEMVGFGHATKADTVNRLAMAEHNNDGTHIYVTEVDIRKYATNIADLISGVEDLGAALQAAIDAYPSGADIMLPIGTFKETTKVYFDSATAVATFRIKGQGKGTIIKPSGFTSGYMWHVNEDSGGSRVLSSTRHPRLIVEDLSVNGTDSTSVSFVWYNTASVQFKNLTFDNLLYGLYGTGYVDLVKMDTVWWSFPRTNGWLYRQGGMGDGFSGRQLFSGGSEIGNNMVWLYRCHGGSIVDSVGGYYRFEECSAVAVRDGHFEERTTTEGNHGFQIINSHVVLENNHIRSDFSTYDSIYVDDVDATKQTTLLVLRNNVFVKNLNVGNTIATRDVRINNLKAGSKIVLDNNAALLFNVDITDMSPWDWYQQGIRVRSAVGALDTALLKVVPLLSGHAVIENLSGSWSIHPVDSLDIPMRAMPAPTIDAITQVASPSSDLVDTTTYYYRVENVDCYSRYGVASAETSQLQAGTNSNKIEISGLAPNSFVRVMRGTAAGTYDRWVDIPTVGGSIIIHDCGGRINQYPWTVAGYTHHTTGVTYTGVHNAVTGKKTLYGTAAPTAGTWVVGDKMYDTAVAAAGYMGWVCTTAGSPGTWKTFGAVTA